MLILTMLTLLALYALAVGDYQGALVLVLLALFALALERADGWRRAR